MKKIIRHGFELIQKQEIPELNTQGRLFRHLKTGAELLSLENDDENKVFGVAFRTPPPDSTGVAHIMEHAVLGGSRKYQVREPFVELLKGSLKTYVNAFTGPDRTVYPVASQNLKDFYNLIDVYLDAVFYPLITPHHLDQEGWHYELEKPTDRMIYKGIVFNEMKGVYSSPEAMLARYSRQSLFPDHIYGLDSGGDPTVIPDLTYEQFKWFHQTYYHPSNARLFFYGDDPADERLRLLDLYLQDFEQIKVESTISLQPLFEKPRQCTYSYSMAQPADGNKGYVQLNWLLPQNDDPVRSMALSVLSYALLGTPASPLRKALLDSGLGEDITGGGLSTWTRQMTFAAGLKGIQVADAPQVELLIIQTLTQLAQTGLDPDTVAAAVNTIEFSLRENNTGSFPRGLSVTLRALNCWIYDGDPFAELLYEGVLTTVKNNLDSNPTYLQSFIQTYLLENPHRTTVVLEPDETLGERQEAAEKEKLAQIQASLSSEEIDAIIANTKALRERQSTPDSAEALATIPHLTLADLEKKHKLIPIAVSEMVGAEILHHDLFTNHVVYLDIAFDLRTIPAALLPYIRLFGQALLEMGTEHEDYVKLSQRIGRDTGGIYTTTFTSIKEREVLDQSETVAYFVIRGKATTSQAQVLLDILRDILLTVNLKDQARFRQIVLKAKARKEGSLVPSGHGVINGRLRSHFSEASWASEQMGGLDYLFSLRQLASEIDNNWPAVQAKLEEIHRLLLNRRSMVCNITLDEESWRQFEPNLKQFLTDIPASSPLWQAWSPNLVQHHEGLTMPSPVNYVGKGANLYEHGYVHHGSTTVITAYLRTTWLWEKVRVQGGAYGGFIQFSRRSGVLTYLSYRDPNTLQTLTAYDGTADYLRGLDLSQAELVKAIIGKIGDLDAYEFPDAKGYTSMLRYLLGTSDEQLQQYRDEVLSTTSAHFKAFADVLDQVARHGRVVMLGSPQAVSGVNEVHEGGLKVTKIL